MTVARALDGVRVLDLTRLLPGAYATLLLADLGADVVKIEDPRGGDGMRHLPAGSRPYFELLNRNKRSVTLDLRSPDAAAVFDALAARSDVVVESFRPSTARRLGVDAVSLRARHPRLICASISGFGQDGPYVERAAHDVNYQSLAGIVKPGEIPQMLLGDISSSFQAAVGIAAALFQRERTGAGAAVDVSIHEAAFAWSMFPTTADISTACYTIYETADGRWLAMGGLEPKFWAGFCERIGRPDLIAHHRAQGAERDRLLADVRAIMRTRTRDEWLSAFAGDDVCLSTIQTREEAYDDPHLRARGVVARDGEITYVTAPGVEVKRAPALGADTDAMLEDAGIDAPSRARLRAAGVIGSLA